MKKIKVLVIDDSALVRRILKEGLSKDRDIEVVDTAADPYIARDKIIKFKPDVLTLDIKMPRMDGIEFLHKLMKQYPLPVIVVSSMTKKDAKITFDAFEAGAVDVVLKPGINIAKSLTDMLGELREKIKVAASTNISILAKNKRDFLVKKIKIEKRHLKLNKKIIAIGASTGGTVAIRFLMKHFTIDMPGIVIVQHMPSFFTKSFAESLNGISEMEIKEAEDGDSITHGKVIIARGDYHMRVIKSGNKYYVKLSKEDKVKRQRPSVDVLFSSVAKNVGSSAIGVILTGMGDDGDEGMLEMKMAGAYTIAQDESSSVVYGMPKSAIELGGVREILPLERIPDAIYRILNIKNKIGEK